MRTPLGTLLMSHDFAKIPVLIIMFAIDMFHQIRKFAKTTQVVNRGTILRRTTAPYRHEQKTQAAVFYKIKCPLRVLIKF